MSDKVGATPVPERVETYARSGARRVRGWLDPGAARLIAELGSNQSSQGAVGEIGVHHGKLFVLLDLLRRPGEASVAIDLFEEQHLNVDHSGQGDRQIFEANLARYSGGASSVDIRTADSTTLSTDDLLAWGRGPYRLFSVDGGHTADITAHDLRIASGALEEGGLMILDDYFNGAWPGVSEGTCRFMATSPDLEAIGSGFNKMFFARPEAAEAYRQQMRRVAAGQRWKLIEHEYFGRPHVVVQRLRRVQVLKKSGRRIVERVPLIHDLARRLKRRLRH
jgi:hypothetical protein